MFVVAFVILIVITIKIVPCFCQLLTGGQFVFKVLPLGGWGQYENHDVVNI